MERPTLLAVPNFSEGRSADTVSAIGDALAGSDGHEGSLGVDPGRPRHTHVRLLDVHSDRDHHRSVFTLAGRQGALATAVLRGARTAVERIDVVGRGPEDPDGPGQHPHVGALDVAPIVYLDASARGAACAEALTLADRLAAELEVPVYLYGELTADDLDGERTRARLRSGGVAGLVERIGRERPDFGPPRVHPTAGATLVAAREPLVAFNLQLAPPATLADARKIAGLVREGGEQGLPGLRAIGVALAGDVAQVSMNVERPLELPLAAVVSAVARHAPVASAELVGLAPAAALDGFPDDVPFTGFDPARHVIENALGC